MIGTLLPLAIAVTISPIPIIAEILLLFTKKPVANAAAYLAGFVIGVGAILGVLVVVASAINLTKSGRVRAEYSSDKVVPRSCIHG